MAGGNFSADGLFVRPGFMQAQAVAPGSPLSDVRSLARFYRQELPDSSSVN